MSRGRGYAYVDGGLYSLERAKDELFEELLPAKVVRVSCAQEKHVSGDDAVLARADGLDRRDNDVEEGRDFGKGEDEHLVREAAVPDEGVGDALVAVECIIVLWRRCG